MDLDRLVATAKKSVPSSTHTPGAQEDNSEPKAVRTEALLRTSNLFHDIPERVALPARLKSSFIRRCRRNERGLPASPTTAGQLRGCSHPQLAWTSRKHRSRAASRLHWSTRTPSPTHRHPWRVAWLMLTCQMLTWQWMTWHQPPRDTSGAHATATVRLATRRCLVRASLRAAA